MTYKLKQRRDLKNIWNGRTIVITALAVTTMDCKFVRIWNCRCTRTWIVMGVRGPPSPTGHRPRKPTKPEGSRAARTYKINVRLASPFRMLATISLTGRRTCLLCIAIHPHPPIIISVYLYQAVAGPQSISIVNMGIMHACSQLSCIISLSLYRKLSLAFLFHVETRTRTCTLLLQVPT